jgi:hypothetical protein
MRHLAQARNPELIVTAFRVRAIARPGMPIRRDSASAASTTGRRFAEDKIVAVVPALPEPVAVLALMNRGIEFGDRQKLVTTDKAALVAKSAEIRKHVMDISGREMPILALEDEQWGVLAQNPLGALQNPELGSLDVDLEQRHAFLFVKIVVQGDQRHRQRCKALRLHRLAMKRGTRLMTCRHEKVLIAGMRIDGLGFNRHVAKPDRPADPGESPRQFWLRLERNHPAIPNPARQPIDETALVGADVADHIAGTNMPADNVELGPLVAKPRLQRANPKPETFGRKPCLEN